jgi:prepilin-type N-terminal cleavage/methylation domain-containing protein
MKLQKNHAPLRLPGFTLVELLVVITIIVVLAALSFTGASFFIKRAAAVKDASTLRQITACINMYAADYNDYLPGPLFSGQTPVYRKELSTNIKEWRRLAECFAPYLGKQDPVSGEVINSMTSSWQKTPDQQNSPAFYMQQKLPMGEGKIFQNPWGLPAPAASELRVPMKLQVVIAQPKASRTWAMTELDQLHPNVGNADWKSRIPPEMIHGDYRLALYFDGSVGKVNQDNSPK